MTINIVLHGAESTGKSTLARQLASHYKVSYVPEYGRTYCEAYGNDVSRDDLVRIMYGHVDLTSDVRRMGEPLMFSDTDPLMTAAWHMMMFGERNPDLDGFADVGDLYLLLEDDLPWVDDGLRVHRSTDERQRFQNLSRDELERRNIPYIRISGAGEERFVQATQAIDAFLANRKADKDRALGVADDDAPADATPATRADPPAV